MLIKKEAQNPRVSAHAQRRYACHKWDMKTTTSFAISEIKIPLCTY